MIGTVSNRGLVWRSARCLAIGGALFLCLSHAAVAQIAEPQAPNGTGPLPDFQKGAKAGVLVTREHTDKYRAILPPELADLVDSGEFSFEAALRPRQPIEPPHGWPVSSQSGVNLLENGSLSDVPGRLKGFLFAPPSASDIERDAKAAAYRVLWNTAATMWGFVSFSEDLSLVLYRDPKSGARKLSFSVSRIYPKSVGVTPGTLPSIFRERLVVKSPQVLESLRWLTLRFLGDVDDYVWVSSPVTGDVRQLTGSNRSDALFNGVFAPDDLFVWSGKAELVQPASIRLIPLLVPVTGGAWEADASPGSDGCTSAIAGAAALELNSDTHKYAGSAGWVPTNIMLVLRNVWKIETSTKDPFSLDARQTIYVDAATNLPVYRAVWDQDGRLRKFIVGILGAPAKDPVVPKWRGQITASSTDQSRTVLMGQAISVCTGEVEGRRVADFDPSLLLPTPAPQVAVEEGSKAEAKAKRPQARSR